MSERVTIQVRLTVSEARDLRVANIPNEPSYGTLKRLQGALQCDENGDTVYVDPKAIVLLKDIFLTTTSPDIIRALSGFVVMFNILWPSR